MAESNHAWRYELLKAYGFSPAKAGEVALDCLRGQKYALAFLNLAIMKHPELISPELKP